MKRIKVRDEEIRRSRTEHFDAYGESWVLPGSNSLRTASDVSSAREIEKSNSLPSETILRSPLPPTRVESWSRRKRALMDPTVDYCFKVAEEGGEKADGVDVDKEYILSKAIIKILANNEISSALLMNTWRRVFSLRRDGCDFNAFLARLKNSEGRRPETGKEKWEGKPRSCRSFAYILFYVYFFWRRFRIF